MSATSPVLEDDTPLPTFNKMTLPPSEDFSQYKNICFISYLIKNSSNFSQYLNSETYPVIYNDYGDREQLKADLLSQFTEIDRVCFVFHGPPPYTDTSFNPTRFIHDEMFFTVDENTGNVLVGDNHNFIQELCNTLKVKHVDFMACNLLQSTIWKSYLNLLQHVVVGASDNNTGNIKYGGDWVMESTMEDIRDVYFTTAIENYTSLLYLALNNTAGATNISTAVNLWFASSDKESAISTYGHIREWDVTGVTNMFGLFINRTLTDVEDISGWDVRNVINMRSMFQVSSFTGTSAVLNHRLSRWNTGSVTSMVYMFNGSNFSGDISGWDVRNVIDIDSMFIGATSFNGDLSRWRPYKVTSMNAMFQNCSNFNNESLNGWDVSNVRVMSSMFQGSSFNGDISGWNTKNVTSMSRMFQSAPLFNKNLNGWDVGKVTDMSYMFSSALAFNGDLSGWKPYAVTTMANMFASTRDFSNNSLSGWDVSNVQTMNSMFSGSQAFNGNIRSWKTLRVTDMAGMFSGSLMFNQDLSDWVVSSVTTMNSMFLTAQKFNGDISKWNTVNVQNMNNMFQETKKFNCDISGWDVKNVSIMSFMFYQAVEFNRDLSVWEVPLISAQPTNFKTGATLFTNDKYYPHWGKYRLNPIGSRYLYIAQNSVYVDAGVSDSYPNIIVTSNVNTALVGNYTVEYNTSVTSSGTTKYYYQIRYVTVRVFTAPFISRIPTAITSITYPAPIGSVSLSGESLSAVGGTPVTGTFTIHSTIYGNVFNAGTYNDVSATFIPNDLSTYSSVSTSVPSITVLKATPFLATRPSFATIAYPKKLGSSSSLVITGGSVTATNGGFPLDGTFTVHPNLSNTTLPVGTYQDISAIFTPSSSTLPNSNYGAIETSIQTLTVTIGNTYLHTFYTVSATAPTVMTRTIYDDVGGVVETVDISFGGQKVTDVMAFLSSGTNPFTVGVVDSSQNKIPMDIALFGLYSKQLTPSQQSKLMSYVDRTYKEPHTIYTAQYKVSVLGDAFRVVAASTGSIVQDISFVSGSTYLFDQSDSSNTGTVFRLSSSAIALTEITSGIIRYNTPGTLNAYMAVSPTTTQSVYGYSKVTYYVKVVYNVLSQRVFAISTSSGGTYYNQPNLVFTPGRIRYSFDVSDPSVATFNLVFGSAFEIRNTSLYTVVGTPGTAGAYVELDVSSGYSGTTVQYFEQTRSGMGYYTPIVSTSTVPIPDNIWHKFERGDISGTGVYDYVSNTYSGTISSYGGATTITDISNIVTGGFLDNTGSSSLNLIYGQRIKYATPTSGSKPQTANLTMSFWMKLKPFPDNGADAPLFYYGPNDMWHGANSVFLEYQTGGLSSWLNNSSDVVTGASNMRDGNWHHICIVVGTSFVKIYYDNVVGRSTTSNPINTSLDYTYRYLFGANWTTAHFLTGNVDDFRMYNYAFTASQVSELYSYREIKTTYTVTVIGSVIYLDGQANPALTFVAGKSYIFYQSDSTNTNNQIGFSTESGGNPTYMNGVTIVGTPGQAGAYTKLELSGAFTGNLYYQRYDPVRYYYVKVSTNTDSQLVFAISTTSAVGTYSTQPNLSFLAGNTYKFFVSDPSVTGYTLAFGSNQSSPNTTLYTAVGTPGQPGAYVLLDVSSGYIGPTILYFEQTQTGMGYVPLLPYIWYKFDEVFGATATNYGTGSSAYNGTITNTSAKLSYATIASRTGLFSNSLASGQASYLTIPSVARNQFNSGATMSLWIYVTSVGGSDTEVFSVYDAGTTYYFNVFFSGANFNAGTMAIQTGRWYHFVQVFNTDNPTNYTKKTYIDNTLKQTKSSVDMQPFGGNLMGQGNQYQMLNGYVADFRFYKKALSETEISEMYYSSLYSTAYVEVSAVTLTVGTTFQVTYYSGLPAGTSVSYTITTSANLNNAPLSGTFTSPSQSVQYTLVSGTVGDTISFTTAGQEYATIPIVPSGCIIQYMFRSSLVGSNGKYQNVTNGVYDLSGVNTVSVGNDGNIFYSSFSVGTDGIPSTFGYRLVSNSATTSLINSSTSYTGITFSFWCSSSSFYPGPLFTYQIVDPINQVSNDADSISMYSFSDGNTKIEVGNQTINLSAVVPTASKWNYYSVSIGSAISLYYKGNITAGTYTATAFDGTITGGTITTAMINKNRTSLGIGIDKYRSSPRAGLRIADFRVYNKALSYAESLSIYKQGPQ